MTSKVYVFGNSPTCNIHVNPENDIAVMGNGIDKIKKDTVKYWFVRAGQYKQSTNNTAENTIVLSCQQSVKRGSVLELTDLDSSNYVNNFSSVIRNPTLGLFSIVYLIGKYDKVYISGMSIDHTDKYFDVGYFWNLTESRCNIFHNLIAESILIKKLINDGTIFTF